MALQPNEKPNYANTIDNGVGALAAATAGTLATETNACTIKTAGANGTIVRSLIISTNETADRDYFIFIVSADGMVLSPLGIVNVPLGSGSTSLIQSVDAFAQLVGLPEDNQGKNYIELKADYILKASCVTNMTAATNTYFSALSKDFEQDE